MNQIVQKRNIQKNIKQLCYLCVLGFVILLNAGCASNANFHWVNPEYIQKDKDSVTFLVMPVSNDFEDIPKYKLANHQLVHSYFNSYMRHGLPKKTTSRVFVVEQEFNPDNLKFSKKQLSTTEKTEFEMLVPVSGQIRYKNSAPKYVVFFEDLLSEMNYRFEGQQSYGGSDSFKFKVEVEYLLWDNHNQKIAAYGKLSKKLNLLGELPSSETFRHTFEEFAELIVKNGPLKLKSTY